MVERSGSGATPPLLRAVGLRKRLGDRLVVDGIDVSVGRGQIVGLLGPNGAGKTTTFRMIAGLLEADEGSVQLLGAGLPDGLAARVRAGLGYLPQHPALFEGLSVEAQLWIPLEARGAPRQEARGLLEAVGIAQLGARRASELSGGERRRLEIARCLATAPKALLLDEPFAGIDPISVEGLMSLIRRLAGEGLGILLTDHAVRAVLTLCDCATLIDEGRVLASGQPSEIAENSAARRRLLGENFKLD